MHDCQGTYRHRMMPPFGARANEARARSISPGSRTLIALTSIPTEGAADWMTANCPIPAARSAYHFVVRDGARIEHVDGAVLPDDAAARVHAVRIICVLQADDEVIRGSYTMEVVRDGRLVCCTPFAVSYASLTTAARLRDDPPWEGYRGAGKWTARCAR
jgi:hypothetical protein